MLGGHSNHYRLLVFLFLLVTIEQTCIKSAWPKLGFPSESVLSTSKGSVLIKLILKNSLRSDLQTPNCYHKCYSFLHFAVEMEFGSCVPASVCPNINCEMIKQRMAREARLPATIRDSLNCSAKCCRNGKCTTTPSSPSLPSKTFLFASCFPTLL